MVLVTGATGHLGNTILKELVKRGIKARAFVLPNDEITHIKELPAEIFYGNILDMATIDIAMKGCSYVIHTAALVSIGNTFAAKDILNVNVVGVKNILESARNHNIKKVVHVSSIHAFNTIKGEKLITELTLKDPKKHNIVYARSKALALEVIADARSEGQIIDVLFPTGIIGPFDYKKANNALYPIRQFLRTRSNRIFYFKAGYDFVDVRDVAKIAVDMIDIKTINNEFIISGEYITLKDIYNNIAVYKHKSVKLVKVPRFFLVIGIHVYFFFVKLFRKKAPITPQAFEILTSKQRISSDKIKKTSDFKPMSIKQSLKDSVDFIEGQQ